MHLLIRALDTLKLPVGFIEWVYGHGPAPLPELASWPSPLPTAPLRLDDVFTPSPETDLSLPLNGHLPPILTHDDRTTCQTTAPTTKLIPSHPSHTSSFESSDPSTDFAITLVRPRLPQGSAIVVLPRIETHVYLDIVLPSRSWNTIHLPLTKSVTSDNSSNIGEGIKPLLLVITVRGATTQQ